MTAGGINLSISARLIFLLMEVEARAVIAAWGGGGGGYTVNTFFELSDVVLSKAKGIYRPSPSVDLAIEVI